MKYLQILTNLRNTLNRFLRKYIVMPRFILSPTTDRNICKLEYKKGDEMWRNSIWLTYWWFGKNYWLVVFL